jgi:hypothetical protein
MIMQALPYCKIVTKLDAMSASHFLCPAKRLLGVLVLPSSGFEHLPLMAVSFYNFTTGGKTYGSSDKEE